VTFTPGGVLIRAATRKRSKGIDLAKLDPAQFVREVRQEVSRVTWPSRKETLVTTGLVLALSALAAVFFLVVDQLIQLAMRFVFGIG
jgi:preprotein translocase subunit SecE